MPYMPTLTNQFGSQSIDVGAYAGLIRFAFWVGVRTPDVATGISARLDMVDSLGFVTSSAAQNIDATDFGSSQGYFSGQCDGTTHIQFVITVSGVGNPEYDVEWDLKGM